MRLGDLLNVSELRELIKSRHIIRRDHPTLPLSILNYSNECLFENYWPETVQHCRGLIINPVANHEVCDDCEVISRPFHKFFNLNHSNQLDYQEANLPQVIPTVTEKMDGWFGILWKCGDYEGKIQYGIASRGSFTSPGALFGTDKLRKLIKYGAIDEFPKGYSAIFEIIFKAGKIVVDYPFEGLVLLGLVNNETGEELPYDELFKVWAKILTYSQDQRPWIRLVKAHHMGLDDCKVYESSVQALIKSVKHNHVIPEGYRDDPDDANRNPDGSVKNMEGFVLTYPRPGTWPIKVKVKLEEYKRLHKLITGITPQQIWRALHDPMAPWLGGDVPNHFRTWAIKWRDELYSKFQKNLATAMSNAQEVHRVLDEADKYLAQDRKIVFNCLENMDKDNAPIAMALLDGKIYEAHQAIWKKIRPVGRESETFYREGQGE